MELVCSSGTDAGRWKRDLHGSSSLRPCAEMEGGAPDQLIADAIMFIITSFDNNFNRKAVPFKILNGTADNKMLADRSVHHGADHFGFVKIRAEKLSVCNGCPKAMERISQVISHPFGRIAVYELVKVQLSSLFDAQVGAIADGSGNGLENMIHKTTPFFSDERSPPPGHM